MTPVGQVAFFFFLSVCIYPEPDSHPRCPKAKSALRPIMRPIRPAPWPNASLPSFICPFAALVNIGHNTLLYASSASFLPLISLSLFFDLLTNGSVQVPWLKNARFLLLVLDRAHLMHNCGSLMLPL